MQAFNYINRDALKWLMHVCGWMSEEGISYKEDQKGSLAITEEAAYRH